MMNNFFTPRDYFSPEEWIFRHKVMSLLIVSFILGVIILFFSIYRLLQGYITVGIAELIFGSFLIISFFVLRKHKSYYAIHAKIFFILSYIMLILLFIYIPEPTTRIHWVPTALVFIFFLLDYKGGILFLFFYLLFIVYLMLTSSLYSFVEYITWISSLSVLALIMYYYEKVKEREKSFLMEYTDKLQAEVDKQTIKLQQLNNKLEERVDEEVKQRLAQEQMFLHQCRLASMGEMIDSIAHQWRQPLMNINAILMNMDRAIETEEKSKAYLEDKMSEVIDLTGHMSQTIEDFRSLFKEDKTKTDFDIDTCLTYTLALLKSVLNDVNVQYSSQEEIKLYGYKNEFIQVIIILLSNATEILFARDIESKMIDIQTHKQEMHILISIEDNAGGISQEYLSLIFDPYFTTKERTGGTGLGLYVAKIIIEQNMKGTLKVYNTKKGAKFEISIPL